MDAKDGNSGGVSMNILFIHQNFPAQFKFLAPALVKAGHKLRALTIRQFKELVWEGIEISQYLTDRGSSKSIHPWLTDFETKVIRGEACFNAAVKLKKTGYLPDVIIAHPGWGESLFLKEVWPSAMLGLYCEFYYSARGLDVGFDPEFTFPDLENPCRMTLKNINNLFHITQADAGLSPTIWQANTFPEPFRNKITVSHDGIDTTLVRPDSDVSVTINGNLKLTRKDKIITYVARNLEPLRGTHIFLRSLPEILSRNPDARVLIAGSEELGYGAGPSQGGTWKDALLLEIRPKLHESEWNRIHFVGQLPYSYFLNLLQISAVHVYLTYPFVLSWSILEAMSAGCAVVASSTGPVTEVIEDGSTGRLFDFFDVEALAAQVCELLDDPGQRKVLGEAARKFVAENHDLQEVCLPQQIAWTERLVG